MVLLLRSFIDSISDMYFWQFLVRRFASLIACWHWVVVMNVSRLLIPSLSVAKLSFRTRPVYNSKNGCRSETSEEGKSGYLDDCATNPRMNEIYFAILLCSRFCRNIIPLLVCFNTSASWRSSALWAPTSSIISLSIVLNNKTLANACLLSGGQGFQVFPCMVIVACDTTTQR